MKMIETIKHFRIRGFSFCKTGGGGRGGAGASLAALLQLWGR